MAELDDRLRRLAQDLDEAAPSVGAAEARQRGAGPASRVRMWSRPWTIAIPAALVVVVAAAALTVVQRDDDTALVTGPGPTTTSPADATSTSTSTTSTTSTTTATTEQPAAGALPGEPVQIHPYAGAALAVVGVAAGDELNVRTGPGTEFDVAFTLRPLEKRIRATGNNRSRGSGGFWSEVTFEGRSGWASSRFLLQPGAVDDVTSRWYPQPADRPQAASMEELARTVARRGASEEPPSKIVIVDGPHGGDVSEITVDVIGLGDDSVGGMRLHVFADERNGRFTLRSIEATTLCSRGVSDGSCV